MSRYDIMPEHVDMWPPVPGAIYECKSHRYVALIEGFESQSGVGSGNL